MHYIYLAKRPNNTTLAGALTARHSFEALHNARIASLERGGSIRSLILIKLS